MRRYVAIKAPKDPPLPTARNAFLREAQAIAGVHHPNICPVHDVGVEGELPYIVMRYVSGGTLADLIERDPPTPAQALRFAGQIANGLEEAHAHGIIHRDLKPANVLYDEKASKLLLTDFGVARWADATHTLGGTPGTPFYMAPEQWGPGGEFGDISARTDVYCLGVMLFEWLTGSRLFDGTIWQLVARHCQTPPRRPSEVRPSLDPRLDELCLKALAKQQSERYSSAKAFADAIAKYLRPPAIPTPPVVVSPPPPPPVVVSVPGTSETRDIEIMAGVRMTFCWIPPGKAKLGSPRNEKARSEDEVEHDYTSQGFWLGKHAVAQAEWKAVMGSNPSSFDGKKDNKAKGMDTSRFPVESVSWDMICGKDGKGGFLAKVNAHDGIRKAFGKSGRFALPHEDEWEYACRGGRGNKQPFYWGDKLNGTEANIDGNYPYGTPTKGTYLQRTCAVDAIDDTMGHNYEVHPWGLMHLHGNVWEWCENLYDQTNSRVLRGGSWGYSALICRAAYRGYHAPDYADGFIGFRLYFRLD
jgi:formylglycine-generating enzyme